MFQVLIFFSSKFLNTWIEGLRLRLRKDHFHWGRLKVNFLFISISISFILLYLFSDNFTSLTPVFSKTTVLMFSIGQHFFSSGFWNERNVWLFSWYYGIAVLRYYSITEYCPSLKFWFLRLLAMERWKLSSGRVSLLSFLINLIHQHQ